MSEDFSKIQLMDGSEGSKIFTYLIRISSNREASHQGVNCSCPGSPLLTDLQVSTVWYQPMSQNGKGLPAFNLCSPEREFEVRLVEFIVIQISWIHLVVFSIKFDGSSSKTMQALSYPSRVEVSPSYSTCIFPCRHRN